MRLRKATAEDIDAILALKAQLKLQSATAQRGGFLLGSSAEQYQFFIQHGQVLLLEGTHPHNLLGFAIGLDDQILRQTDLWERRHVVQWHDSHAWQLEALKLAYIEQLAVLPGLASRLYAPALALALVQQLFVQHDWILTTTVDRPIRNTAVLPLLKLAGAKRLGWIEENYPVVGTITSALHGLERSYCQAQLETVQQQLVCRVSRTLKQLVL